MIKDSKILYWFICLGNYPHCNLNTHSVYPTSHYDFVDLKIAETHTTKPFDSNSRQYKPLNLNQIHVIKQKLATTTDSRFPLITH